MPSAHRTSTPCPSRKGSAQGPPSKGAALCKHKSPRWLLQDSEREKDDSADAYLRFWDVSMHKESDCNMGGEMVVPMRRSIIATEEASARSRLRRVGFDIRPEAKVKELMIPHPPSRATSRSRTKKPFACMPFDPKSLKTQQNVHNVKTNWENSPYGESGISNETDTPAFPRHISRNRGGDNLNKSPCFKRNLLFTNSSHILPPPPQFGTVTTTFHGDLRNRRSVHEKCGESTQCQLRHGSSNNAPGVCIARSTVPKNNLSAKDTCKQYVANRTRCSSPGCRSSLSEASPGYLTRARLTGESCAKRDGNMYSTTPHRLTNEHHRGLRHVGHLDKSADSEKNQLQRVNHAASDLHLGRAGTVGHKTKKDSSGSYRPVSEVTLRVHRPTVHPASPFTWSSSGRKRDIGGADYLLGDLARRTKTATPTTPRSTKNKTSPSEITLHLRRHKSRDPFSVKLPQMKCNPLSEVGGYSKRHNIIEATRRSHTSKFSGYDLKQNSLSEAVLRKPLCSTEKLNIVQEWLKRKRSVPKIDKSASDLELFTHRSRPRDVFKSSGGVRVWSFPKNPHPMELKQGNNKLSNRDPGSLPRTISPKRNETPFNANRILQEPIRGLSNTFACSRLNSPRNKSRTKSSLTIDPRFSQKKCHNTFRSNSLNRCSLSLKTASEPRLTFENTPSGSSSPVRNMCLSSPIPNVSESHLHLERNQHMRTNSPSVWRLPKPNSTAPDLRSVLKRSSTARASSVSRNAAFTRNTDTVTYDRQLSLKQNYENDTSEIIRSIASCYEPRNWVHCTHNEMMTSDGQHSSLNRPFVLEGTPRQNSHSGRRIIQSPKKSSISVAVDRETLENKMPIKLRSRNQSPSNKFTQLQVPNSKNAKKVPLKRKKINFGFKEALSEVETAVNWSQQKSRNGRREDVQGNSPKRSNTQHSQEQNTHKFQQIQDGLVKSLKTKRRRHSKSSNPEERAKWLLSRRTKNEHTKQSKNSRKKKVEEKTKGEQSPRNRKKGFVKPERRKLNVQVPLPSELLMVSTDSIDSRDSTHRKCAHPQTKVNVHLPKEIGAKTTLEPETVPSPNCTKTKRDTIKRGKESIKVVENKLAEDTHPSVASITTSYNNKIACYKSQTFPDTTISCITDLEMDHQILKKGRKEKKFNKEASCEITFRHRSPTLSESDATSVPSRVSIFAECDVTDRKCCAHHHYCSVKPTSNLIQSPTSLAQNVNEILESSLITADKRESHSSGKKKTRNRKHKIFDSLPLPNQYALNDFSALLGIAKLLDIDPSSCVNMMGLELPPGGAKYPRMLNNN